jgi:hypothetical protein
MSHTQEWIAAHAVPRRPWFGLLYSYCAYHPEQPAGHGNWLRLRQRLNDTMPILLTHQKRPKLWSRLLEEHRDILTDHAGRSLRHMLFHGSASDLEELNKGLPVADSSWLWQRVIAHQIAHLNGLNDQEFMQTLPAMLKFLAGHPHYADEILAALLTRYCQSAQRHEPNELLKTESFSRWGNPQLVGSNRWTMVEQPVRAMVLRWFAKEDLEHFFSMLQGAGQVDKDRLVYWSDFVDQITYTRILLGPDALHSPRPEFRKFRDKNAGRYGRLTGGPGHNNAFIMRINDQFFVEFSGTGNACYAYSENEMPFNPQASELHTNMHLKHPKPDPFRRHGDNRIRHSSGWQLKADLFLADRGIHAGASSSVLARVKDYQAKFSQTAPDAPAKSKDTQSPPSAQAIASAGSPAPRLAVQKAMELARINGLPIENNLHRGGYLWLLVPNPAPVLERELLQLGLEFRPGKGYCIN